MFYRYDELQMFLKNISASHFKILVYKTYLWISGNLQIILLLNSLK